MNNKYTYYIYDDSVLYRTTWDGEPAKFWMYDDGKWREGSGFWTENSSAVCKKLTEDEAFVMML